MHVLAELRRPDSVVLTLRTLTPLYTGGIGQHGDQIHPSGLLGGLRRFSCLLAAAVGDADFETRVWGSTAEDRHAKQIALRVDASSLKEIKPVTGNGRINWPRSDGVNRQGWYYNAAHEGDLRLTLTRRGIENDDWLVVLLALRIQIKWATFGSRDQWGLGVLDSTGDLPGVDQPSNQPVAPLDQPSLHRAFFARLEFDRPAPKQWRDCLEQGLRWREHLRGSFRKTGENELRHYLFGHLAQGRNDRSQGGSVNVSALYPVGTERCALRVWGIIPHTKPAQFAEKRAEIVQRIQITLQQDVAGATPARASHLIWEEGGAQPDLSKWLNRMAGV